MPVCSRNDCDKTTKVWRNKSVTDSPRSIDSTRNRQFSSPLRISRNVSNSSHDLSFYYLPLFLYFSYHVIIVVQKKRLLLNIWTGILESNCLSNISEHLSRLIEAYVLFIRNSLRDK